MHGNITVYSKYCAVCLTYILYTKMLRIHLFSVFTIKTPGDLDALVPFGLLTVTTLTICKRLLDVKRTAQLDYIYGELGKLNVQPLRLFIVIKYWVKQVYTDGRNYIKQVYNMLTIDMTTIIIGKTRVLY